MYRFRIDLILGLGLKVRFIKNRFKFKIRDRIGIRFIVRLTIICYI